MKLSIIVPVYNSSEILRELNDKINKTISKTSLKNEFELVLVNDFSKDNSWEVIKELSKNFSYIKGINLSQNFGQHNAIMAGLSCCTGDKIITLDDDLQHPPEFIPEIINKLNTFDVCYTNYKKRKHIGWKIAVSKINNVVSSSLLNKSINIYMSSFRGFNKKVASEILKYNKPDVYIDGIIIKSTKNIGMITVDHYARKFGESNYDLKKLFILWSNMVLEFPFFH